MARPKATKVRTFKVKTTKKRKPKFTPEQIDKLFDEMQRIAYGR